MSLSTVPGSLRDRQIAAILQMLNLNEGNSSNGKGASGSGPKEPVWKVLIYDRVGMDILTPLFTVQELRQNGITLHIPLHSPDRTSSSSSSIPDVPAIYFGLPNDENVERICRDIQSDLYGSFYLNFIRPVPRSKIEDIASAVLSSSDTKCVNKIYDQYVDFVCLEDELFVFSTDSKNAEDFYALNRPSVTDTEMNAMLDNIVDSLFSVLVTYGQVPIIRTPKGNAAEQIGEKLDKKIRDNLRDPRVSLFQGSVGSMDSFGSGYFAGSRPLLVILDRNMDLATPLAHSWTYQSLTHDVLQNTQNQVKFMEEQPERPPSQKTYSVDTRRDPFWSTHRGSPFPTVAEAIQNELEEYRKSEDEVKKLKQTMGLENPDLMEFDVSDNTARLTNAIKDLPQLLEKKRVLDGHTSIATAILSQIKSRSLDAYYEMESKLLTKSEAVSINNVLLTPNMGTFEDKMRLYLIYYLVNSNSVSKSELDQFLQSLSSVAMSEREAALLDAVEFVKRWISYSKMTASIVNPSSNMGSLQRVGQSSSMLTKLVSGSSFLMEGVRNLVFKRQNLPLTKITLELMEGREAEENYRYFDPKQLKQTSTKPTQSSNFNDCIVFVVGGGNYIEYQNMVDCFKKKDAMGAVGGVSSTSGMGSSMNPTKRIIYGASCLYNGSEFLAQLARLGQDMK